MNPSFIRYIQTTHNNINKLQQIKDNATCFKNSIDNDLHNKIKLFDDIDEVKIKNFILDNQSSFDRKKNTALDIDNINQKIAIQKQILNDIFIHDNQYSISDKITFLLDENSELSPHSYFNCIDFFKQKLTGLSISGYFPYSRQRKVKVSLVQGDINNLHNVLNNINKIIDYIKPYNDNGDKLLSLNHHSSTAIKRSPDLCWSIVDKYDNQLNAFNSLIETLMYCQDNYFHASNSHEYH